MSHGNGTIYGPNIDVRGDVAAVLGRNTGDVYLLCSDQEWYDTGNVDGNGNPIYAKRDAGAVKPWPKFKPIRDTDCDTILTLADRQDAYFGFKVDQCGPNGNIATFISNYASQWQYLKPRGIDVTPIEWCRILDFDGYDAAANSFVNINDKTFPASYTVGQGGVGVTFHLGINAGNNLHAGSISINDFKLGGSEGTEFANCYFGLIFVSGPTTKIITGNTPAQAVGSGGTGGVEVFIAESNGALSGLTTGTTYTVYPVLSIYQHSSLSNFANTDIIIALPVSAFTFKPQSPQTTENIAIRDASAWLNFRARTVYSVTIGHRPVQSITVYCYVYQATSPDDRTGTLVDTQVRTFTNEVTITPSSPLMITNSGWLRIYCQKENVPAINAETFVQVSEEEPEI